MKMTIDEGTTERVAVSCQFSLDVVANQDNFEGDSNDWCHYLNQASESPLWITICDFLSTSDDLEVRATAQKWNVAKLYGPHAELFFFLLPKDDRDNSASRPEWPELQPSERPRVEVVRNSLDQVHDNGARRMACASRGGSLRQVSVGETLRGLSCKVATKLVGFLRRVHPGTVQVETRTRGWCWAGEHTRRQWTKANCGDPDRDLLLVEPSNAFNSLSRRQFFWRHPPRTTPLGPLGKPPWTITLRTRDSSLHLGGTDFKAFV